MDVTKKPIRLNLINKLFYVKKQMIFKQDFRHIIKFAVKMGREQAHLIS